MSKVFIEETTLTNIGSAIREKTGKSDLIAPGDMPAEIRGIVSGGGGDVEIEPIVLSGDCSYSCAGAIASSYMDLYGNTITTKDITNSTYMFLNNKSTTIPFDINYKTPSAQYSTNKLSNLFNGCKELITLPKLNNVHPYGTDSMFQGCERLRIIPEDYFDDWQFPFASSWGSYDFAQNMMFYFCYSLRKVPIRNLMFNPKCGYYYSLYYNGFAHCYVLDELIDIPVYNETTWSSNSFNSFLSNAGRVKNVIFKTNEDGTPIKVNWKSQTLTTNGWGVIGISSYITQYNSGITTDKEVVNDITYQALKNDPDWYTTKNEYSRYNRISAVNTINSLPDASDYLATAGGTNTIKFSGAAGAKTDGGAINTMTEEEIAVATAKGWTVTFT